MKAKNAPQKFAIAPEVAVGSVSVWLPIRIHSEANRREHYHAVARRKRSQQLMVSMGLMTLQKQVRAWPAWRVTLHRRGKRMLDDDNLQGGFKAVRDAVARVIGVDDADKRIKFDYSQDTGKEYLVRIGIERVQL